MNKKLISLAVAAAMAAPAAAMAEATLYGKLHVSIDYQDVTNAISPEFQEVTPTSSSAMQNEDGTWTFTGDSSAGEWTTTVPDGVYSANGELVNLGGDPDDPNYIPIYAIDADGNVVESAAGQDFDGWGISGRGSAMQGVSRANRLGVKGSEDLGNGLKAIYQVEFGVNFTAADDNIPSGGNGGISMRNSFVGLAGNWGTFLVGRHDTPLKISTGKLDLFSDTMADYNGTVGFQDLRVDNTVAYISPSFSGFSLAAAVVAPGGATALGVQNIDSDSLAEAYSIAAIYNNGPFYASAAYESLSNDMFMDTFTSQAGDCNASDLTCSYVDEDFNKWRFGLGLLDWNGFTLTGIFEDQENIAGGQTRSAVAFIDPDGNISLGSSTGVKDQQLWQIQAGYAFGNNMFKAMYGQVTRDSDTFRDRELNELNSISDLDDLVEDAFDGDRETWAVGFDHNFSKRTRAYVLYTDVSDDNDDNPLAADQSWSGFSLGMIHKF